MAFATIFELAARLRRGEATARGLAALFQRRLRRYGAALAAVVTMTDALAAEQAAAADAALSVSANASGGGTALLLGIPYGACTCASAPLRYVC